MQAALDQLKANGRDWAKLLDEGGDLTVDVTPGAAAAGPCLVSARPQRYLPESPPAGRGSSGRAALPPSELRPPW